MVNKKSCSVTGCARIAMSLGFCNTHYRSYLKYKDPSYVISLSNNEYNLPCKIENCTENAKIKALCEVHYKQLRLENKITLNKEKFCKIDNCDNTNLIARGLCRTHYTAWRRSNKNHKCSVLNCNNKEHTASMCNKHYQRKSRYGDPNILLTNEKGNGWINNNGYKMVTKSDPNNPHKKRKIPEHRFIMEQILGRQLFNNENVHHKNGNKLDNNPENLELWVKTQPCGQRAEDLLKWAQEIIQVYGKKNNE